MKEILWYQNPNLEENDDFLFIDGVKSDGVKSAVHRNAFQQLMNLLDSQRKHQKKYCPDSTLLYKVPNGWLLKGVYDLTDTEGRKTAFLYYAEAQTEQEFIQAFEARSSHLNLPHSIDWQSASKETKLPTWLFIIISVALLLLLAAIAKSL